MTQIVEVPPPEPEQPLNPYPAVFRCEGGERSCARLQSLLDLTTGVEHIRSNELFPYHLILHHRPDVPPCGLRPTFRSGDNRIIQVTLNRHNLWEPRVVFYRLAPFEKISYICLPIRQGNAKLEFEDIEHDIESKTFRRGYYIYLGL